MDCPIYATSITHFSPASEDQNFYEKELPSTPTLTPQCEKTQEVAREYLIPLCINHSISDEKKIIQASSEELDKIPFLIRKSTEKQVEYNRRLFFDAVKKKIIDVVVTKYSETFIQTIQEKKEIIELAIEYSQRDFYLSLIQGEQSDRYLELINHSIEFGLTFGHIQFIEFLLNQDAQFLTHDYIQTLRLAINAGQLQVIHFFITDGRFNFSKHAFEIYELAIQLEDYRIFERLLYDPKILELSQGKNHLLKHAIMQNRPDCVQLLLNDPRLEIRHDYDEILEIAVKIGNVDIFESLLNDFSLIPLPKKGKHLLEKSVTNNQPDFVYLLLNDARVNISEKYSSLLSLACKQGYFEIVKILSNDLRFNLSYKKNKSLREAIIHGHRDITDHLLNHPRINLSKDANKIFRVAIKAQQELVINTLLQNEQLTLYMKHKELQKLAKNKGIPQIYSLLVNFLE